MPHIVVSIAPPPCEAWLACDPVEATLLALPRRRASPFRFDTCIWRATPKSASFASWLRARTPGEAACSAVCAAAQANNSCDYHWEGFDFQMCQVCPDKCRALADECAAAFARRAVDVRAAAADRREAGASEDQRGEREVAAPVAGGASFHGDATLQASGPFRAQIRMGTWHSVAGVSHLMALSQKRSSWYSGCSVHSES